MLNEDNIGRLSIICVVGRDTKSSVPLGLKTNSFYYSKYYSPIEI